MILRFSFGSSVCVRWVKHADLHCRPQGCFCVSLRRLIWLACNDSPPPPPPKYPKLIALASCYMHLKIQHRDWEASSDNSQSEYFWYKNMKCLPFNTHIHWFERNRSHHLSSWYYNHSTLTVYGKIGGASLPHNGWTSGLRLFLLITKPPAHSLKLWSLLKSPPSLYLFLSPFLNFL